MWEYERRFISKRCRLFLLSFILSGCADAISAYGAFGLGFILACKLNWRSVYFPLNDTHIEIIHFDKISSLFAQTSAWNIQSKVIVVLMIIPEFNIIASPV